MINRDKQLVTVITFIEGVDEYGQPRIAVESEYSAEMVIKPYQNANIQNPVFNDVTLIALSDQKSITEANSIKINNQFYDVIKIIPSNRFNQLFLKPNK